MKSIKISGRFARISTPAIPRSCTRMSRSSTRIKASDTRIEWICEAIARTATRTSAIFEGTDGTIARILVKAAELHLMVFDRVKDLSGMVNDWKIMESIGKSAVIGWSARAIGWSAAANNSRSTGMSGPVSGSNSEASIERTAAVVFRTRDSAWRIAATAWNTGESICKTTLAEDALEQDLVRGAEREGLEDVLEEVLGGDILRVVLRGGAPEAVVGAALEVLVEGTPEVVEAVAAVAVRGGAANPV